MKKKNQSHKIWWIVISSSSARNGEEQCEGKNGHYSTWKLSSIKIVLSDDDIFKDIHYANKFQKTRLDKNKLIFPIFNQKACHSKYILAHRLPHRSEIQVIRTRHEAPQRWRLVSRTRAKRLKNEALTSDFAPSMMCCHCSTHTTMIRRHSRMIHHLHPRWYFLSLSSFFLVVSSTTYSLQTNFTKIITNFWNFLMQSIYIKNHFEFLTFSRIKTAAV